MCYHFVFSLSVCLWQNLVKYKLSGNVMPVYAVMLVVMLTWRDNGAWGWRCWRLSYSGSPCRNL